MPKIYEAQCKHPVTPEQVAQLLQGVELREPESERAGAKFQRPPETTRADAAESFGTNGLRLTLMEGKYHQVKRMIAAVGNRCESLHRPRFGNLTLPPELAPGQWAWVASPSLVWLEGR